MGAEVGKSVGGRYTIVRHLATGGMAELHLARMTSIGGFTKEVVIKRIHPRKNSGSHLHGARHGSTLCLRNCRFLERFPRGGLG